MLKYLNPINYKDREKPLLNLRHSSMVTSSHSNIKAFMVSNTQQCTRKSNIFGSASMLRATSLALLGDGVRN